MTSQESNGQTSDRRIHQALNARPLLLSNQLKLITFLHNFGKPEISSIPKLQTLNFLKFRNKFDNLPKTQ
jgi:hypothetical protein